MTEKEKLLNASYDKFMDIGLSIDPSYDMLEELAVDDVMGYGTAVDEKLFTLSELRELLITQERLLEGVKVAWERTPVLRRISADGNSAVFADDIMGTMIVENETMHIFMRFSCVMEFIDKKWRLVHWHGSKPENVQSEVDGFGIDKWKQRNAELEKLVQEKTADLLTKNRELEIETSLERVRSIALSMKEPADMLEVCRIISQQSESLGITEIRNVQTAIIYESKGTYLNYEYYAKHDKLVTTEVDYKNHELQSLFANQMLQGAEELFASSLKGKEVQDWYEYQKTTNQFADSYLEHAQFLNYYFYSLGPVALGISTYAPLSEEEISLFKRFRNVFDLAYRRFLDIEQAEAQVREARLEAALERVRSRTMAMQKSEELADVAMVLFRQIQQLGIKTWTTGFNVWQKGDTSYIDWVVSTSEGRFMEPYTVDLMAHPFFMEISKAKQRGDEFFVIEAQGETLAEHYRLLFKMAKIQFEELVEAGFEMPEHQINHFVFGAHVSLMFITFEPCPELHDIFKRFGKVFEQTYTRFLDLQKVEAQAYQAGQDLIAIKEARKNAEEALKELQATQKQLIQSEKMASLGELTAGIAHEIQNPLNFVNNFSEVSSELLDEMNIELERGDIEEAKFIASDVKQNLEKINHHGKRAADIVKGMLQHSRTSTGQKELADINALADEYLRLAYHGLRAKDKSFNATMKTDFDETLPKINMIPQDIGRVLLNLINNAFYAVNEKKHQAPPPPDRSGQASEEGIEDTQKNYEPTVWVGTKRTKDKVSVFVKDNGNGIPQSALDKIFQPFFTTKPTGQGTGLGLSLSYDIVKANGGEISVESNEGHGTVFTILIPIS